MLNLLWPWALALAPLPFIYRCWRSPAETHVRALRAPLLASAAEGQSASGTGSQWLSRLILLLLSLCWLATVAALSRPLWIGEPVALPTNGRDILLAVDISGSMERDDMQLNGRQAIGDAIGLAVKRLQDRPEHHRVVILLTDGANNAGELEPLKAADLAQRANVKIYTIGIGAEVQETWGLFGKRVTNPSADLDEATLTSIAQMTGGQFFRARDPEELKAIYAELNRLEPLEQDAETIRPVATLFHWPLGIALALSLLIAVLRLNSTRKGGTND